MKSNSLQEAMAAFLQNNPELPQGEEPQPEKTEKKPRVKLNIAIEKKGRNGKTATIIYGLEQLDSEEVTALEKELKKKLGVGGSSRGDEILIQGDMQAKVKEFLQSKGYRV